MKDINQSQGGPDIYRIYKLLKKTRIKTGRGVGDPYTTNKEEIKIKMKITKKKDILTN